MSGLRSSRNLLAPPTLIRAGNPESPLSGCNPGVKSFHLTPQAWSYMVWSPNFLITNAELNIDADDAKKIFFGVWICGFYTSFSGIYAIMAPVVQTTFGVLNYSRDYGLVFTQSVNIFSQLSGLILLYPIQNSLFLFK